MMKLQLPESVTPGDFDTRFFYFASEATSKGFDLLVELSFSPCKRFKLESGLIVSPFFRFEKFYSVFFLVYAVCMSTCLSARIAWIWDFRLYLESLTTETERWISQSSLDSPLAISFLAEGGLGVCVPEGCRTSITLSLP